MKKFLVVILALVILMPLVALAETIDEPTPSVLSTLGVYVTAVVLDRNGQMECLILEYPGFYQVLTYDVRDDSMPATNSFCFPKDWVQKVSTFAAQMFIAAN